MVGGPVGAVAGAALGSKVNVLGGKRKLQQQQNLHQNLHQM